MNFSGNDLSIIRHRLGRRFHGLSMSTQLVFPIAHGIECADTPSGTALIVRVPLIGRVWLLAQDDGFTIDDMLLKEWQNCLHRVGGNVEYIPESVMTIEAVIDWITGFVREGVFATQNRPASIIGRPVSF